MPTVYLKYIIENYDNLPNKIAFIHGHENSVHQKYPKGILQAIEDAKINDFDFISLNNLIHLKKDANTTPIVPIHTKSQIFEEQPGIYNELRRIWPNTFASIFGPNIPEYFRIEVGAQFIVSRKAIYKHDKSVYEKLYNFVIEPNENEYIRAIIMEFIWHMLFTYSNNDMCNNRDDKDLYYSCNDESYRKSRFNYIE